MVRLKDLEALVDEYYDAAGGDPRRLRLLSKQILELVRDIGLDHDAGIAGTDGEDKALEKLDAYLCDLKELQIRDGLHIFGVAPEGRLLTDLTGCSGPRATRARARAATRACSGRSLRMRGWVLSTSISPLVGEMSDRTEGGKVSASSESVVTPSVGRADISPTRGEINPERSFDPLDCILSDPWTRPPAGHSC
jgi:cobaltochelatase CobN